MEPQKIINFPKVIDYLAFFQSFYDIPTLSHRKGMDKRVEVIQGTKAQQTPPISLNVGHVDKYIVIG